MTGIDRAALAQLPVLDAGTALVSAFKSNRTTATSIATATERQRCHQNGHELQRNLQRLTRYLGHGRTGFLDVLRRMGANIAIDQPSGTVLARTSHLRAITLGAADIPDMIDEIPIVAAAAAHARGTTVISGARTWTT